MRIIAGKYRHRLITWPDDAEHIRPTKDRIREAFFNAIGNLDGMVALDLYAGSGALGIEALSRDAKFCYFVDCSKVALTTIKKNLEDIKIPQEDYKIIPQKDTLAINIIDNKVDLVFLDPPYKEGKYKEIIELLSSKILNDKAIIVCESDHALDLDFENYTKTKEYRYGDIYVTILWR